VWPTAMVRAAMPILGGASGPLVKVPPGVSYSAGSCNHAARHDGALLVSHSTYR